MCCLRLNFHTNNVSLDSKVILVTVQNARAFSSSFFWGKKVGREEWKELCCVRVHGFGNVFVEEVFEEAKQAE